MSVYYHVITMLHCTCVSLCDIKGMRLQTFLSERENQPVSDITFGSENTVLQRNKNYLIKN